MAETIYARDGRVHILFNEYDFKTLVSDVLGQEAAQYVQVLIDRGDKAYHQANTDFNSYEMQVEELTNALRDIGEVLKGLEKRSANLAKSTKAVLDKVYDIIDKNL